MDKLSRCATNVYNYPSSHNFCSRKAQFAVDTNSRKSDKLERMEMIRTVAEQVAILGGGHTVDLKNADKTILVEVYKVDDHSKRSQWPC